MSLLPDMTQLNLRPNLGNVSVLTTLSVIGPRSHMEDSGTSSSGNDPKLIYQSNAMQIMQRERGNDCVYYLVL